MEQPGAYVLQVGSYRNRDDAERLRAKVAKLGIEARVQHVAIDADELHRIYARQTDVNGAAVAIGGGLQWKLTRALAVKVADFQYLRSWAPPVESADRSSSYRFSTGVVLRMGTW